MTTRSTVLVYGMLVVWRLKDNKGWRIGYVRAIVAGGRIIELNETDYATWGTDRVALADIDWYIK